MFLLHARRPGRLARCDRVDVAYAPAVLTDGIVIERAQDEVGRSVRAPWPGRCVLVIVSGSQPYFLRRCMSKPITASASGRRPSWWYRRTVPWSTSQ